MNSLYYSRGCWGLWEYEQVKVLLKHSLVAVNVVKVPLLVTALCVVVAIVVAVAGQRSGVQQVKQHINSWNLGSN